MLALEGFFLLKVLKQFTRWIRGLVIYPFSRYHLDKCS